MTPERWQQIERLYHLALAREVSQRATFLEEACRGDETLRQEIESLLSHEEPANKFMDAPGMAVLAQAVAQDRVGSMIGQQLGAYQILSLLGAGGMGEVYRAEDTRLDRIVAIKVLPEHLSSTPQVRERFEREAKAISSLNHPHICTLHDVGHQNGINYLVMEYLEGQTLADRLKKGSFPLDQVLQIAVHIADALETAHRHGVIHRDLKPGNIMLTKAGAKVLDFGVAKVGASGTVTRAISTLTEAGAIIGTVQYMSPEQVQGQEVDARSDIFSFGLVLYEMITGKCAFEGASPASIIAAILEREPPELEPEGLNRVVRACLAKDPADRFQTARDLKRALEWSVSGDGQTPLPEGAPEPGGFRHLWLAWSVAAGLAVCLALVAFLHFREKPPAPNALPELVLSIVPPNGRNLVRVGGLSVERISPDGSAVVYRANDARFHIRSLGSLQDHSLPPFVWGGNPFWAPDSKSIAFPTVSGLMKMQIPNGATELITTETSKGSYRGGSWSEKGTILFAIIQTSPAHIGLYGVPATGGRAFPVEVPGVKEGRFYNPEFLPGGEDFLFVFTPSDSAEAQLFIATMRGGKAIDPRLLFSNDTAAAFTSAGGGHILWVRNDNLYPQRIDVKARHLVGDPELVQEGVASNATSRNAYFSVSRSGTVVWRRGTAVISQVMIFDRKGNRIGSAGASVPAEIIGLAPDEAHVLVSSSVGSWVMESNGPGRTSLGSAVPIVWTPDGSGLIGVRGAEIVKLSITGSAEIRMYPEHPASGVQLWLHDISGDGRRILYSEFRKQDAILLSASLDRGSRPEQVVEQRVDNAAMSPDGAWTVYHAESESGIYVHPLTSHGLRRQIANSGNFAVWRKDGKEILYFDQDRIWSVRVDGVGTQLRFTTPVPLFSVPGPLGMDSGSRPLAVSRDGLRIYFLQSTEEPDSGVIQVRIGAFH
jgi:serine/threonine protein kinase